MIADRPELAQTLFEEAGDALFLFDPDDGRVVEVNPIAQRLSGMSRPALLKESVETLFRSDTHGGLGHLERACRTTGIFHAQDDYYLHQRAAGRWLPVNITVSRLHVRPKTLCLITARDVSDRKRSESLLRLVWDTADGMRLTDAEGVVVMANPAYCRLVGKPAAEVVGRPMAAVYAPARRSDALRRHRELFDAQAPRQHDEVQVELWDGRRRWYEVAEAFLILPGDARVLLSMFRDTTDRREAEERVRRSEERFRALIEKSFDGLLLLDREAIITYASPSATRILGYPRPELTGRAFSELVPREDLDEYAERHRQVAAEASASAPSCGRYRHADGQLRWLEVRSTNLLDEPGVGATVVNFRDVTEQRELEERYRQSQKMEAVGQLAGGVAHDFNNMLTVINGYSEVLLQCLPPDDPSREALEEIRRAGERSAELTRQLLAFSRQQILALRLIDLNAVVTNAEKMLRRMIGEDVELVAALDPALGAVRVDPGQVEQILLNLAVNARDAMPTGGQLTIETRNVELDEVYARLHPDARPGRHVLLAVSDTGTGMTEEVKSRLFEPFFTTKGPGKGTGLGLATVYGIVRQSGGHLGVYSELGFGTVIKVYLPWETAPARAAQSRSAQVSPPRGTETVLLVEDEDGVRELTRNVLAGCGYEVLAAATADEAVELAAGHQGAIDLLLTDVVMPGRGGRSVADRVTELHPRTRVMFMSGYTDDAVVRHGVLREGMNFLQKPFSPLVLAHRVRDVLDQNP
jgi:two-component system, cell cycle sensor histidine kinase and response regulator CckA